MGLTGCTGTARPQPERGESTMGVVKVIELLSQSESSWEDATRKALEQASKTVRNIKSIYVKEFQAIVEDNQITQYRVNCKVSFSLDGSADQQEHAG